MRCRPPFDDEASNGIVHPVVSVVNTSGSQRVSLEMDRKGKRREFLFDVCVSCILELYIVLIIKK